MPASSATASGNQPGHALYPIVTSSTFAGVRRRRPPMPITARVTAVSADDDGSGDERRVSVLLRVPTRTS